MFRATICRELLVRITAVYEPLPSSGLVDLDKSSPVAGEGIARYRNPELAIHLEMRPCVSLSAIIISVDGEIIPVIAGDRVPPLATSALVSSCDRGRQACCKKGP